MVRATSLSDASGGQVTTPTRMASSTVASANGGEEKLCRSGSWMVPVGLMRPSFRGFR